MAVVDFPERARRDACPGALQTHAAADGAVARVRVPGGLLTAGRLRELGAAAADLGSGVIELTSRANVQVRGLTGPAAARFAERMAAAGLLPSATHERVRNILASPLAGLDGRGLLEIAPLVRELDAMLLSRPALSDLPGRFLFALDDGRGDVAHLPADITYIPLPPPASPEPCEPVVPVQGAVLLAGRDTGLRAGPREAVALMIDAAEAFLTERAARGSTAWRIAELADGPEAITTRLHAPSRPTAPGRAAVAGEVAIPAEPGAVLLGPMPQADGRVALVVMPPLGRLTAAQTAVLAAAAEAGPGEVRLTPWRGVIVPGLTPEDAERWRSRSEEAGLVTDPRSPWSGVSSCAGRPGCEKSLSDVQTDATQATGQATTARAALLGDTARVTPQSGPARAALQAAAGPSGVPLPVHWVGCERRCGRPSGDAVLVVATGDGYRVEAGGGSVRATAIEDVAAAVTAARDAR
ncbi:precorrin-3B synthase [Sphaerisporangium krabiense]|uniref:Precorrin-3B synthase n=1 Tax=Sphaerisporangium krabiense TaxID=763782 RepID=A0A7W8Z6W1_9ACTN|nr:nitrite/sulfite reductase [Sphaerisporangium krabiense]MBB5628335.1 precorrin-3B synthase [Sphaerisporangium krabiense]GII66333.1 precorrin-3B synthase [Sphaerisporangium krabiense]